MKKEKKNTFPVRPLTGNNVSERFLFRPFEIPPIKYYKQVIIEEENVCVIRVRTCLVFLYVIFLCTANFLLNTPIQLIAIRFFFVLLLRLVLFK